MVDRDDDARLGVRSSALTLGRWDVAAVMASYAAMLAILARARRVAPCSPGRTTPAWLRAAGMVV